MNHQRPIFVTGGCGFVGAGLCATLVRAGETVVAIDNLSTGSPENWPADVRERIELVQGDIRDAELMSTLVRSRAPKTIFHLAAIHFIPACDEDPAGAISVNVTGTQIILTAALGAADPPTVVLASTGAVYAPSLTAHAEDALLEPSDIYGLTKLWMEQAAELHRKRTGARIAIARLFNVVGRGETNPHLVPEIIAQAAHGEVLQLGNLTTKRDYIGVDDVVSGLLALSGVATNDELIICNLGAENPIDGHELVRLLGEALGQDLTVLTDPSKLRVSDRPVLESDCTKARELLGWAAMTPLSTSLEAAVADARSRDAAMSMSG